MVDLERRLGAAFEDIHQQRMRSLPILHPGLRVAVVGGRCWKGDWIGVLITPWSMNLVMIPGRDSAHLPGAIGSTGVIDLPAGRFDLIASEEAGVGRFAACSLFSPMQEFPDQASALETAELIMTELFDPKGSVCNDSPVRAAEPRAKPQRQHQERTARRTLAQQSAELQAQSLTQPSSQQQVRESRPAISRRDLLRGRLRP
jgi:[NiFe] hydrogenase assembly HybE family chaperone